MTDKRTGPDESAAQRGLSTHVRTHAKALLSVGIASVLGILASFVFQLLSTHSVSPSEFGLLSAFIVIVNVAAVGSASLQNSITVATAALLIDDLAADDVPAESSRRRWPVEATILGVGGAAIIAVLSVWLAQALDTTPTIILLAAATIPLSFIFADAMGLLQGSGRTAQAVWWSTFSQLGRVLFAVISIVAGLGLGGLIGAILAALLAAAVGGIWAARRTDRPAQGVFNLNGLMIVALTVAFAWLTSSDVIFLRAGASSELAGLYATATVLVKAGLLLPATLSLYLLPRFVKHRDNPDLARIGVLATLALSLATSLAMIVAFAFLGDWLIGLLFSHAYGPAADLLVPAAVAYLPWIAAQGMMIKMTSSASRGAAALLIAAVIVQWVAFSLTIPNVYAMMAAYFAIGLVVLVVFLIIDVRQGRALRAAAARQAATRTAQDSKD
ncbi:hypothetical protein [Microbacterium panaciterrae]|uniref:Membrane protein involved in the export of O-antigen and teichoic acid n=1 Tax=Microbacterium panaciterrae TaxID=985759 RepID=A0ABP8PCC2_9MICO